MQPQEVVIGCIWTGSSMRNCHTTSMLMSHLENPLRNANKPSTIRCQSSILCTVSQHAYRAELAPHEGNIPAAHSDLAQLLRTLEPHLQRHSNRCWAQSRRQACPLLPSNLGSRKKQADDKQIRQNAREKGRLEIGQYDSGEHLEGFTPTTRK